MPAADDSPPPAQLKDWFNEARYRSLAAQLKALAAGFDEDLFLKQTLEGLEARSLMERLHQAAVAVEAALPGSYRKQVAVLKKLAPQVEHGFVSIFLCDFVATFGREDVEFSLEALRYLTTFGSAEFAVRPFLAEFPQQTMAIVQGWVADENEHVRRLASEGTRPRLPWGMRLTHLVRDPSPCAPILEALKDDESLYVRKSVANHLNDISKDHPEWVLKRLENWDLNQERQRWIARQACRTLIKRGDPRALRLLGFGGKAKVDAALEASPQSLRLGDTLVLEARIRSTSRSTQRLAVDYVVHYVKARGGVFEKVFKWSEIELAAGAEVRLTKRQTLRDFTTRRHHAGLHRVELQVNGQRLAQAGFELRL
ncbi:MAG: DNA alkylation repair protein [Verrucomicrobiales bacterium]|nr:DNA alkylation repair protein [Verrucomicrobiales bacterium]